MTAGVGSVCLDYSMVESVPLATVGQTHGHHWQQCKARTQQSSNPYSNVLWSNTSHVANGNGLESVEYMIEGAWLGDVSKITDFKQFIVSLWYQLQVEILPQTKYDTPQSYLNTEVSFQSSAMWPPDTWSS
ncbi:hypothetical protein TNCV_1561291 [Trichonephila clavipes]|nr:hypothetical protein TNCV_1561291 [Trichonephila clavipes]